MPKHCVLVSRILADRNSVEIYYLVAFGGRDPTPLHSTGVMKCTMYLLVEPQSHDGYLTITSCSSRQGIDERKEITYGGSFWLVIILSMILMT